MNFTFVRHAQSEANVLRNLDERDSRLTKLGISQCKEVKGHFDIVLCSPLRRTRDTLGFSQVTCNEVIYVPEARECRWSTSDLMADDKEPDDYDESTEEIEERCKKFYERLRSLDLSGNKKVLIVSHCNFIHYFTDRYSSQPVMMENAQMKEITIKC